MSPTRQGRKAEIRCRGAISGWAEGCIHRRRRGDGDRFVSRGCPVGRCGFGGEQRTGRAVVAVDWMGARCGARDGTWARVRPASRMRCRRHLGKVFAGIRVTEDGGRFGTLRARAAAVACRRRLVPQIGAQDAGHGCFPVIGCLSRWVFATGGGAGPTSGGDKEGRLQIGASALDVHVEARCGPPTRSQTVSCVSGSRGNWEHHAHGEQGAADDERRQAKGEWRPGAVAWAAWTRWCGVGDRGHERSLRSWPCPRIGRSSYLDWIPIDRDLRGMT
jgi:hypothetical protein